MPILRSLLGGKRGTSLDPMRDSFESMESATGKSVSPQQSMRVSAVYAGVRLLAETISSLPADLVISEGGRRKVQETPLAQLLTEFPNPEQDAPELWRSVIGWMLLDGNGYVYIERDSFAAPIGLWVLPSSGVTIGRTRRGDLYYKLNFSDMVDEWLRPGPVPKVKRVGPESVLHFKAFGTGTYGLSPIQQVREAVATSLSAQEYMGRFYKQDASPGGVLTTDGNLTDDQFERLNKQWRQSHSGVERSHLLAVLEGGTKWESVGLNPQDAAFIETQKWETVEIARALGVPPHMIGDVERSTSWGSGIAEQGIGFVTYTLTPWITRLEWVVRHGILRELDPRLRLKWRVDGLQRGDTKSRYEGYAVGRNWGWLSANDIRSLEDMDPIEGGDAYLQPLNMVPAGNSYTPPSLPPEPERGRRDKRSAAERRRIAESFAPLIADADGRLAAYEKSKVERLVRVHLEGAQSPAAFIDAVEELYGAEVAKAARERFGPVFATFAASIATSAAADVGAEAPDLDRWVQAYTASHVNYRTARAVARLRNIATDPDAADLVRVHLDEQVENRPAVTARWESTQLSRASTREAWKGAGIRELRWVAVGDTCDICQRLDGKVVGIEQPFAQEGDLYPAGEGKDDLVVGRSTFHPPIHPGCDCDISTT